MVVMLFGIGFLAILTANIAFAFVKTERGEETEAILMELSSGVESCADLLTRIHSSALKRKGREASFCGLHTKQEARPRPGLLRYHRLARALVATCR